MFFGWVYLTKHIELIEKLDHEAYFWCELRIWYCCQDVDSRSCTSTRVASDDIPSSTVYEVMTEPLRTRSRSCSTSYLPKKQQEKVTSSDPNCQIAELFGNTVWHNQITITRHFLPLHLPTLPRQLLSLLSSHRLLLCMHSRNKPAYTRIQRNNHVQYRHAKAYCHRSCSWRGCCYMSCKLPA